MVASSIANHCDDEEERKKENRGRNKKTCGGRQMAVPPSHPI